MNAGNLIMVGVSLILLGFLAVFAGTLLSSRDNQAQLKGAGVVFIGPIPLIFGSDKKTAIVVSFIAIALMLAHYLVFSRKLAP